MHLLGEISLAAGIFMALASFFAGFVDSIAGGGGLIQLPALLIGLPQSPVVQVLGTNKLASFFGTGAATIIYRRRVKPDLRFTLAMAIPAFFGSLIGASLAAKIPTSAMRPIVLALLIAIAIYTWRRPSLGALEELRYGSRRRLTIAIGAGALIGFYDGIFGPGTGTFLMLVLVASLGFAFLSAASIAKVVNLSTNLGALIIFGFHGVILWRLGLMLAVANVLGGTLGAHVAIRGGSTLVRKVFLFVTLALIVKVGIDTIARW